MKYHIPVLLEETLLYLQVKRGFKYIDCTLGDGGHTLEILKLGGIVLGIDYDSREIQRATNRIFEKGYKDSFVGVKGNFKNLENIAKENNFNQVNGILYDLGYSSYQLDRGESGLTFTKNEPLDMRLDETLGVTAADLVNSLPEKQLAKLIFEYSNERYAFKIAKAIINFRNMKEICTTKQLADLIVDETPPGYEKNRLHPATRTFQALRIVVNDELLNLKESLPWAARLLKKPEPKKSLPGGRLLTISFQSLEDKTVKDFGRGARALLKELVKKPIVPNENEISQNIRARSAKLRIYEKI